MWRDNWGLRWNYHLLAKPGYVVLLTNYSGSTGFGEAFAQSIQGDPLKGPAKPDEGVVLLSVTVNTGEVAAFQSIRATSEGLYEARLESASADSCAEISSRSERRMRAKRLAWASARCSPAS